MVNNEEEKPRRLFDPELLGTLLFWELINITVYLLIVAIQNGALVNLFNVITSRL